MTASDVIAYIGIGSNLDDPLEQCRSAVSALGIMPGVKVLRVSSFYRTEPVGYADQDDFINAVCEIRTSLLPRQLLTSLKATEKASGRREEKRWGPRIIDLDLLLYDQEVINEHEFDHSASGMS